MVGTTVVNGFGIQAALRSHNAVARHLLRRCTSVFTRLASVLGIDTFLDLAAKSRELADSKPTAKTYSAFVSDVQQQISDAASSLVKQITRDPFRITATVNQLDAALTGGPVANIQCLHGSVLERLDAALTMFVKGGGDRADIGQNARWQGDLLTTSLLTSLRGAKDLAQTSRDFDHQLAERRVTTADYPGLVEQSSAVLQSAARRLQDGALTEAVTALDPSDDPTTLQLLHRRVLLRLDDLANPPA